MPRCNLGEFFLKKFPLIHIERKIDMKKRIHGLLYSTDTAKLIFDNQGKGDKEEKLYRKRTGEFFLYTKHNTLHDRPIDQRHSLTSGELLVPLTYEEAKAWSKETMPTEKYNEVFKAITQSNDKIYTGFSLTEEANAMLQNLAHKYDKDISGTATYLIMDAYKNQKLGKFDSSLYTAAYPSITNSKKKCFVGVNLTTRAKQILKRASEKTRKTLSDLMEELIRTKYKIEYKK